MGIHNSLPHTDHTVFLQMLIYMDIDRLHAYNCYSQRQTLSSIRKLEIYKR